jgi:hypothetical protein
MKPKSIERPFAPKMVVGHRRSAMPMSDIHPLALRQTDQARTDFALIESDLEVIAKQLAAAADAPGASRDRARHHVRDGGAGDPVDRSVLASVTSAGQTVSISAGISAPIIGETLELALWTIVGLLAFVSFC